MFTVRGCGGRSLASNGPAAVQDVPGRQLAWLLGEFVAECDDQWVVGRVAGGEEFGDGQGGDRLIAAQRDRPAADFPSAVRAERGTGERHAVVVQDHLVAGDGER